MLLIGCSTIGYMPDTCCMDVRGALGANIRKAREGRSWSQEELADRSGIHRTYISGLERAVRNPTIEIIASIATALELPVATLLEVDVA